MASPPKRAGPRPVPGPSNPVLLATQAKWLFTDAELKRTPSQLDGMKWEDEQISRSKGVNFIAQVGIMLKLPQITIATAAVYFHRFFMRYSMVVIPPHRIGIHPYEIAATSLFLSTKVEENVRKMREFVVACCRVGQKQPNLIVDEQSKEFWKWRDTILHHEDLLLEALCFDIQLEQPYRILYDFLIFFGVIENKAVRNASWAFVNDSAYTVLCLQFTARTIAAAALYAAAMHCGIGFEDDDAGQVWWKQVDVDIPTVRRACTRLAELYENNAMQRHSPNYPTTPVPPDCDLSEKTRIARPGAATPPPTTNADEPAKKEASPQDNTTRNATTESNLPQKPSANDSAATERPRPLSRGAPTAGEGTADDHSLLRPEVASENSRTARGYSPVRSADGGNSLKRPREPEEDWRGGGRRGYSKMHDGRTDTWAESMNGDDRYSSKRPRTGTGEYNNSYARDRDRDRYLDRDRERDRQGWDRYRDDHRGEYGGGRSYGRDHYHYDRRERERDRDWGRDRDRDRDSYRDRDWDSYRESYRDRDRDRDRDRYRDQHRYRDRYYHPYDNADSDSRHRRGPHRPPPPPPPPIPHQERRKQEARDQEAREKAEAEANGSEEGELL